MRRPRGPGGRFLSASEMSALDALGKNPLPLETTHTLVVQTHEASSTHLSYI